MAEPTPTTPQQDVPQYVTVGDLVQAADDILAQAAEKTDDDDQLERVRRARQQLFAARDTSDADDDEIATDGGHEIDREDDFLASCTLAVTSDDGLEMEINGDMRFLPSMYAFGISRSAHAAGLTEKEALRDVIEAMNKLGPAEEDYEVAEPVTDGGVAVDAVADADDGDVWSRPFVETDQYGDPTGFEFVRCLDCGAEVLEQHRDDATHKPGCSER